MVIYAKILLGISRVHISVSDTTPIDEMNERRDDWQSTSTVNQTCVSDSNIQQPGFELLASSGACWTDSGLDEVIVLLIYTNGELQRQTNSRVIS